MIKKVLVICLVITTLYIGFTRMPMDGLLWKGNVDTNADVTGKTKEIEIDISSIRTEIIPEDRKDIAYEYNGKGKISLNSRGNKIEVTVRGPKLFYVNHEDKYLKLYLPETYTKDISIKVGSAKVAFVKPETIDEMELENLEVEMGSGRLELAGMKAKETDFSVSSGDIIIDRLRAEKGAFTVSSGKLVLNDFKGSMETDVSSGNFEVSVSELSGPFDIKVSSGYARVDLPDNASFTLKGKISSGAIEHNFALENEVSEKNKIGGTYNGGRHAIEVDVSSGHVTLQ